MNTHGIYLEIRALGFIRSHYMPLLFYSFDPNITQDNGIYKVFTQVILKYIIFFANIYSRNVSESIRVQKERVSYCTCYWYGCRKCQYLGDSIFLVGFCEDELRIPGRTPQHTVFKGGPAIVNAFIFTIRWETTSFVTFLLCADDLKKSNTTDTQVRL
jgi:hypothetical protein